MKQINKLSRRELEVVHLLLQGKSNKLIALALGISDRTVEFHLKNVYAKFQVSSRMELVLKLGNTTGEAISEKLGRSTVARSPGNIENRDRRQSKTDWAASHKIAVYLHRQEINHEEKRSEVPYYKCDPVGRRDPRGSPHGRAHYCYNRFTACTGGVFAVHCGVFAQ